MPAPLCIKELVGKAVKEKIDDLYRKIARTSVGHMVYQERNNIETIKEIIPQIQEFVLWFMEENRFGIEQELYQGLCSNLTVILGDILQALEQGDRVLLHDAAVYGLMEYLEIFLEEKREDESDDVI